MSLKKVDRFFIKAASMFSYIGTVWLFGLMILINTDVWSRVFFNSPVKGTPEIVQNSLVGLIFLMVGWATYQGKHVRSTMIKDRLPQKAGDAIEILAYLIGCILFIGIIAASWEPMLLAWKIKDFQGEGSLRVPTYPLWWVMLFGSLLSSWMCLRKVVLWIAYFRGKGPRPDDSKEGAEAL